MPFSSEAYPWAALAAAVASAILILPLVGVYRRLGLRDGERSLRKIHGSDVPRVGGPAVILAVFAGAGAGQAAGIDLEPAQWALLAAAGVMGCVGLADDVAGLRARTKLAFQVLCAAAVVSAGVRWPALEALLDRNWFSLSVTVLYFVLAANAVNLIDGLDGLAAGVVLFASVVVLGGGMLETTPPSAAFVAALAAGAAMGFFAHNRPPARVFLGDGGAYFLGFLVAGELLFVDSIRPRKAVVELSIPLLALALPLLDAGLAILRRMARGQPIFASDADHVHHRLLARGFSTWGAMAVLWAASAWFSAMALLTVAGVGGSATLAGALAAAVTLAAGLDYHRGRAGVPGRDAEGWRARRRDVVETLRAIERAEADVDEPVGPDRFRRLAQPADRVRRLVCAEVFEVRGADGRPVVSGGASEGARVFLAIPLVDGAELRFGFPSTASAKLAPEHTHAVERLVTVFVAEDAAQRRSGETSVDPAVRPEGESAQRPAAPGAPR